MIKTYIIGLMLFFIRGCGIGNDNVLGSLPKTPVNFKEINSKYDDYNSTAPTLGETFPLCFSSNRNSYGDNFDIIYKMITISYTKDNGVLEVYENKNGSLNVVNSNRNLVQALGVVKTSADEFGPYLIPAGGQVRDTGSGANYTNMFFLLYADNSQGDLDIKFTQNVTSNYYTQPQDISFLNSTSDDAYPTLNKDHTRIYFASNRNGDYDIYTAMVDPVNNLVDYFTQSTDVPVEKVTNISSTGDDLCPFITGDLMVFASNKEGGLGGYDLYYAKFENEQWTSPVNFGAPINTPYDEFRPIIRHQDSMTNDFMLFSSNRIGGLGGFDLYYVGIDKDLP